jgi:NADH dehydrogenase
VVELPNFKFQGYFAWMVWMALHLMLILSIRNKIAVFFNWGWRYITGDTSLRLILRDEKDRDSTRSND